jgi:hypothetical protein
MRPSLFEQTLELLHIDVDDRWFLFATQGSHAL